MNNKWLILLAIFTLVIIQNCTTTEKIVTEKQAPETKAADKELHADLQALKSMLGYKHEDTTATDAKRQINR